MITPTDAQTGWALGHDTRDPAWRDGGRNCQLQHFDPARKKWLLNLLAVDAQNAYPSNAGQRRSAGAS